MLSWLKLLDEVIDKIANDEEIEINYNFTESY